MKKITREDAIRIFDRVTDKDDPFWENIMEEFIEDTDDDDAPLPSVEDVLEALGVTKEEYRKVVPGNYPQDIKFKVGSLVCCRKCWEEEHKSKAVGMGKVLVEPVGMPMIVCLKCGNKRCPHATDHALPCSRSNKPGQPGSIY